MKNKKISMQDIADSLGITKVTVSKALNNQPGVGDELKKKILETAHQLGYFTVKKNQVSLPGRFAFLVPKRFFFENESFYTRIYYYLNKECMSRNIHLSLFVINSAEENNLEIPSMLNKDNYDGLFLGGEMDEAYIHALTHLNIAMVSIDFYKPHIQIDSILSDNFNISSSVTAYLIDKGHKKIGFVGDPKQATSYLDRYFGFQKALASSGIRLSEEWNINNYDPATNYYTMDIKLPQDMPTAFVCQCDMAAYFLIQKLQSSGFKVPQDISIVSFDNTEISKTCSPPLTTVDISKKEFATKAFEVMLSRLQTPDAPPQMLYIQTEMMERKSVSNIKKNPHK